LTSNDYTWIDETVERLGFWRADDAVQVATSLDFEHVERKLGGRLPGEYRYFIEKYGGGMFLNEDYTIEAPIIEPCPWATASHRSACMRPAMVGGRLTTCSRPSVAASLLASCRFPMMPGVTWCVWTLPEHFRECLVLDHEQRWFKADLERAAQELEAQGANGRRLSVHDIIRGWARLHADQLDRPPDYMGMYRVAPTFGDFLRGLHHVPQ